MANSEFMTDSLNPTPNNNNNRRTTTEGSDSETIDTIIEEMERNDAEYDAQMENRTHYKL